MSVKVYRLTFTDGTVQELPGTSAARDPEVLTIRCEGYTNAGYPDRAVSYVVANLRSWETIDGPSTG